MICKYMCVCAGRITCAGVTCVSWSGRSASDSSRTNRTTQDGPSTARNTVCRTGRTTDSPTSQSTTDSTSTSRAWCLQARRNSRLCCNSADVWRNENVRGGLRRTVKYLEWTDRMESIFLNCWSIAHAVRVTSSTAALYLLILDRISFHDLLPSFPYHCWLGIRKGI